MLNIKDLPDVLINQLGTIKNISFPQQGHTSLVIKVETREHQFIIKKTEHHLFNEWLYEEYKSLQYLTVTNILVPKVYAFHIQDNSRWLLMDYIDGISLRHFLYNNPNSKEREKVIASYGSCLKQIHESQCPKELCENKESWIDVMLMKAEYNLANHNVEGTEELLQRLKNGLPKSVDSTLIHGDFHTNNVLVKNNRVVGIIDWPRAALGDPRFDIALAIRPKQGVFDQKMDRSLFFEAYGRLEITEEEYNFFQEGLYKFF